MAKAESVQYSQGLPGQLLTPEVVIVAPENDNPASNNASLPRGVCGLDEGDAPPPFEINVRRATPTLSIDDESCLEELETELQLSVTTTKHTHRTNMTKSRPLSVASTASKTNSSLLALPNNMRNKLRNLARRKKGEGIMDSSITPATSISDLRPINTGMLKKRLDSFARQSESESESEVDDTKSKNSFGLCRRCPHVQSHITKFINHLKSFRCTCDYYVDPYGEFLQ